MAGRYPDVVRWLMLAVETDTGVVKVDEDAVWLLGLLVINLVYCVLGYRLFVVLLGRWIRHGEGFLVDNLDPELFTSPNIRPIRPILLELLIIPQPCHILIRQTNHN